LIFLLFELGALIFDDFDQKLILKTLRSHGKVDQAHLDANFWQVVRVGELGGDHELKVVVVGHVLVTELD
jgi:hypothetical protein